MRRLSIDGVFVSEHIVHEDSRGLFREWYKKSDFIEQGIETSFNQANHSVSMQNVLRGIHYSITPVGQHKLVTCASGKILDVLVELRVGSPTYLSTATTILSPESGDVLFIPTGVGHSFLVLSESASVVYLTSSEYDSVNEKTISPLDPELGLVWPIPTSDIKLSDRDKNAQTLADAGASGQLPTYKS